VHRRSRPAVSQPTRCRPMTSRLAPSCGGLEPGVRFVALAKIEWIMPHQSDLKFLTRNLILPRARAKHCTYRFQKVI